MRTDSTVRSVRTLRARLAAVCLAAMMLAAALPGGAGTPERGAGPALEEASSVGADRAGASGPEASQPVLPWPGTAWTDALWVDTKGASGSFTALQLGTVRNLRCTSGLLTTATVAWERPTGTPSSGVSYRLTVRRGASTQTLNQTTTTYVYNRPVGNFEDVTVTVQPMIEQWIGPAQSVVLDAVVVVGMRCA